VNVLAVSYVLAMAMLKMFFVARCILANKWTELPFHSNFALNGPNTVPSRWKASWLTAGAKQPVVFSQRQQIPRFNSVDGVYCWVWFAGERPPTLLPVPLPFSEAETRLMCMCFGDLTCAHPAHNANVATTLAAFC
jgi:hypothetical protein